ncbi:MPHOSPH6-like, partial [Ictidomys tridecemlineatus]|uniref:M-phase phosphoprotein 6 n=1 Tax=Ictidomys tridecemlineatus TaxID=43179 RepID=A0A287D4R8_ICTTR
TPLIDSECKYPKQLEEEEKKIIKKENVIIEEQSFLLCEDLIGFNPEVEKLMLQMNAKNKAEDEDEDEIVEIDVSDEEMARRYETLVGTIGKKFAKKRDHIQPVKAKKMFLKPHN